MPRLSFIRSVGRFKNKTTGQEVNVKKGRKQGYGVEVYFFLRSGSRVYISDHELSKDWERLPDVTVK